MDRLYTTLPFWAPSRKIRLCVWLLFIFPSSVYLWGDESNTPNAPTSEAQIDTWIRQLDSSSFDERRDATRLLINAGTTATRPLATALQRCSREVSMRGVHILEELALSDDESTREAALVALKTVVASSEMHVAKQRAMTTIASLERLLQQKTLVALSKLGAKISFHEYNEQLPAPIMFTLSNSIELSDTWTGTAEDLRVLEFLIDLDTLILSGESIDDAYLEQVAKAPQITTLVMWHANVTKEGLSKLSAAQSLRKLQCLYTPFGDEAIDVIASLTHIRQLDLYGTGISPESAGKLGSRLPEESALLYHRGGFLGVGSANTPPTDDGLVVGILATDSCAQAAGIELGDVVQQVGTAKVRSFEDLQEEMRLHKHGDSIDITFLRDGESMKRTVVLGEKPLDVSLNNLLPMVPGGLPRPLPAIPPGVPNPLQPKR